MSIKIKRQSLMGDTNNKKKVKKHPSASQTKPASQTQQKAVPQTQDLKQSAGRTKKGLWISLAVFIAVLVIFPKPQLVTYQKLSVVGTSIYWPGILGVPATLFDSDLTLAGEIEEGKIFLCDNNNQNVGCQKYQIVKQEGVIAVVNELLTN